MIYRIDYTARAKADLQSAFEWIAVDSPRNAAKWRQEFMKAIDGLSESPLRCPLAPENISFPFEVRQLLYGKGHGIYRVLFTVKGDVVSILHIRHSARKHLGE